MKCLYFSCPPERFPFDVHNPTGYSIAVVIECITGAYEFFTIACTLAVVIGSYWVSVSATKEIWRILHSICHKVRSNESHSNENRVLFAEFIDAHAAIKQLSKFTKYRSISVYSLDFLFQIDSRFSGHLSTNNYVNFHMEPLGNSWVLFTFQNERFVSNILLQFARFQLRHGNVMSVLLNATLNGFFCLALVLNDCELGQRMTDAFEEINFTLNQFEWYLFPIEIKRMLPAIIANAQKTVAVECFGSIACNRDVFKNVGIHTIKLIKSNHQWNQKCIRMILWTFFNFF